MSDVWIENKQYIDSLYADLDKRCKINWTYTQAVLKKINDLNVENAACKDKILALNNEIYELQNIINKHWWKKIFKK